MLKNYDEEKLSMRMMNEKWESEKVKVFRFQGCRGLKEHDCLLHMGSSFESVRG